MKSIEDLEAHILIMGMTFLISYFLTLTMDLNKLELFAIFNVVIPGLLSGLTAILYFLGRLVFKEKAWPIVICGSCLTLYFSAAIRFNLPLPF